MPIFRVPILRKTDGFTLVECLIVVLLLGIFLTFASVNWNALAPKAGETFLETLSLDFSLLKAEAISQYDRKAVELDLARNVLTFGRIDALRGFVAQKEFSLPEGYRLRDVVVNGQPFSIGKPLILFYSTGFVDRAIIHFDRDKDDAYSVLIDSLTARVTGRDGYVQEITLPGRNKSS